MKNTAGEKKVSWGLNRLSFLVLVLLNVALLSCAFLLYGKFAETYRDSLREENLSNISNLNLSAAAIATVAFENWNSKLENIEGFVLKNKMTYKQALDVINDLNVDSRISYQILDSEYSGHLILKNPDGNYPEVSYANGSYAEQQKAFGDVTDDDFSQICFVPEFTDDATGKQIFAIYKHLPLYSDDGTSEIYTLLLVADSGILLEYFSELNGYSGQSTVIIDSSGNYISRSDAFKSTNFFQYLYKYNNLTLDEKNAILEEVERNGSGELFYKNADIVVEDCVFRYEKMHTNDWYCVSVVPLSSFRQPVFDYSLVVYTILLLAALLVVDVTWLQIANNRLRSSIRREMEANAAKGRFMSHMSHEIRTPLNAIIGYNTIASNELSAARRDEERKNAEMKVSDCLSKSSIASKHLLTIINDVLDMSAIESGKMNVVREKFDISALISSLSAVFYTLAKAKNVEFDVAVDSLSREWFVGDQMRVNQVLTNLLSNAVKFTPEGGQVKLSVMQPEPENNPGHVVFEVSDTGIGMAQEYLEHIWTPFEQADSSISRRFGGTGLGLSITKKLVELMDGRIDVESVVDRGTCFRVGLAFGEAEQPTKYPSYDFSVINALVADDDDYTCEYIKQLFTRCGAKCRAVTSGKAAVAEFTRAKNENEPFTLCLIDWRMPGVNGMETVKQLRALAGEEMPIIVATAYDLSEIIETASMAGASRCIEKPLFQSTLFDLLVGICGTQPGEVETKTDKTVFSGERVLLAEDNMMNMEIAKAILQTAGLLVEGVWNGQEALEAFEKSEIGAYSAILMDVHMPVMDGHTATKAIRALSRSDARKIPIIAMTADAFESNVAQARAAGMNDHIAKPIDVSVLFKTLKKYI